MQRLFEFDLIKTLFKREDYNFVFDGANGISSPYGIEILHKIFSILMENLDKCKQPPDLNGIYPGPNLDTKMFI